MKEINLTIKLPEETIKWLKKKKETPSIIIEYLIKYHREDCPDCEYKRFVEINNRSW